MSQNNYFVECINNYFVEYINNYFDEYINNSLNHNNYFVEYRNNSLNQNIILSNFATFGQPYLTFSCSQVFR